MAKQNHWTPETPWFDDGKETQAHWPTYVCRNKACKSYGKSHPNCHCGAPSFSQQSKSLEYAHGGSVCSIGTPHEKGCEYYIPTYADGGNIPQMRMEPNILGMAAAHHGLGGLLNSVGQSKIADPEKHNKLLGEIKNQHTLRMEPMDPDAPPMKRTKAHRIAESIDSNDHEAHAEMMHKHPLVGSVGKKNLSPILYHMANSIVQNEPHSEAFRSGVDYLHSAFKGETKLNSSMKDLFDSKKGQRAQDDKKSVEELKKTLDEIQENPEKLINIGGNLNHYLPDHSTHLAYQTGIAVNYLNSLKPRSQQLSPLDKPTPIDKQAESKYNRQLSIAANPLLITNYAKEGTLLPTDLTTVQTLYPTLFSSMQKKAMDQLLESQEKGESIPYKKRMSLSLLFGQPLDYTQGPMAARQILQSQRNETPESQQQPNPKQKSSKAGMSSTELKAIEKVDELSETPLEARAIDKRSH